jgi:hypothetical protein
MKKIILLLFFALLLTGCQKQETDVEVLFDSITDGVGLGSSFYGLEPGVATKQNVASRMSQYPYLSVERDPFPEAQVYYQGNEPVFQLLSYHMSPETGFGVHFKFSLEDRLEDISIHAMGMTVNDVLTRWGEPDVVFFAVEKDFRYDDCDFRMYYDDSQLVFHVDIRGNVNRERCKISKDSFVPSIAILSGFDYAYNAENFLSAMEYTEPAGQYKHAWNGYGNLFELYPVHPVVGDRATE